jgi:phage terminase large subunit-like protein
LVKKYTDDATRYALDVIAGKILAGRPVRQACLRHLNDLEHQEEIGIQWQPDLVKRVVDFFSEMLTVEIGEEPVSFNLEPFQRFIVGSLFGWLNLDRTRRFRNAYIEIGKGNGKTPLAAGIGIYGLVADGELSPEVYSAATMREQASICFKDAVKMVQRSPELAAIIQERVGSLMYSGNGGVFRPLSSEHKALDGKRVHIAIIDELHEHPTAMVVDKMRAGTKRRRNALIFRITNSGSDLESVCWYEHEYSLKILDGSAQDKSWFAYICALDEKDGDKPADDWTDESNWIKANPGLGTILPVQYLREQVREATGMASKQNITKRLNFCIWTQQHELWIPIEKWMECSEHYDPEDRQGEACWLGIDLSDKLDLSVVVALFKYPIEKVIKIDVGHRDEEDWNEEVSESIDIDFGIEILPIFFIPEATMYEREKEDRVPYSEWVQKDFVVATPGQIIDYSYIYKAIVGLSKLYSIQQIGYDPRGATQLATQLRDKGFDMVELTQGYNNMSEPAQIFEALVYAGRVRHNDNPVMRWNVQNSSVKHSKDNRMIIPYKSHQRKRIDGVTAACMALGRAMVGSPQNSIYSNTNLESAWL